MSKVTAIDKAIDVNKKHIDEYQLVSEVGTKKMQEKFYKNAVNQRNIYVTNQQEQFDVYKKQVYKEMKNRVDKCFPIDNSDCYKSEKENLTEVKEVIKFINPFSSSNYKLGFLSMISGIKEDTNDSLDSINSILTNFINKFKEFSISLTIDDFSYTMFTKKYMTDFFSNLNCNNVDLNSSFEAIYWECPDFLKHLKINLWVILDRYKKELDNYCDKVKTDKLNTYNLTLDGAVSSYYDKVKLLDINISRDSYINLNNFLDKKRNINDYLWDSSIRKTNFNSFAVNGNFEELDDLSKEKYYFEALDLSKTLSVLKLYYRYEFIAKDLQSKFSKRIENKGLYDNKLKEISKEEAKRKKIYSTYLRACGVGFLARVDDKKIASCKLEMNEQILKLYGLYNELHDLEIIYNMNKHLSEVSSLYDLFMTAYSSYYYLRKMFTENFKEIENFSVDNEIKQYFDFIYSPNNAFLTKINAFTLYDIAEIVADKYRLLELNVSKDSIMKDSIDSTIDTVNFIKLINDIDTGALSLDKMNFIVKFSEFDEVELDNSEVELLQN